MAALGCVIPFVLMAAGALVGASLGNIDGGYWGAGIGFALGLGIAAAGFVMLGQIRSRLQ